VASGQEAGPSPTPTIGPFLILFGAFNNVHIGGALTEACRVEDTICIAIEKPPLYH